MIWESDTMDKLPRYVDIDYAKYAPDIPEDQRETYYGLPQKVQFCKECVMSNQKPNSCYEFEHTIHFHRCGLRNRSARCIK